MIKKFSKLGNSLAILIDKPILKLLNLDEDTQLKIRTDGKSIIIDPVASSSKINKKELDEFTKKLFKEHGEALKKLAE